MYFDWQSNNLSWSTVTRLSNRVIKYDRYVTSQATGMSNQMPQQWCKSAPWLEGTGLLPWLPWQQEWGRMPLGWRIPHKDNSVIADKPAGRLVKEQKEWLFPKSCYVMSAAVCSVPVSFAVTFYFIQILAMFHVWK